MFQWIRKNSVSRERAATLPEEKVRGMFVLGVFSDRQSEDYGTRYRKAAEAAVKEAQA